MIIEILGFLVWMVVCMTAFYVFWVCGGLCLGLCKLVFNGVWSICLELCNELGPAVNESATSIVPIPIGAFASTHSYNVDYSKFKAQPTVAQPTVARISLEEVLAHKVAKREWLPLD